MKKVILATVIGVMLGGVAYGAMPTMNATDHVYGYHLRDVYKDMENMKYDDTKVMQDINHLQEKVDTLKNYDDTSVRDSISDLNNKVNNIKQYDDTALRGDVDAIHNKLDSINSRGDLLAGSVTNITHDISATSDRIDRVEGSLNNSITNINNDIGVIKNDMANNKHNIDNLESTTNKLTNHVDRLRTDVDSIRCDLNHLKSDTAKGLAQANALSSLKYLGGKGLQISIGTGGYRGTSAIAYGIFYGVNDDLMVYAGGTDNSYNASINLRIGGK